MQMQQNPILIAGWNARGQNCIDGHAAHFASGIFYIQGLQQRRETLAC